MTSDYKDPDEVLVQVSVMLPISVQSTLVAAASGCGSAPSDWAVTALRSSISPTTQPVATASPTVSRKKTDADRRVPLNLRIPKGLDSALQQEALKEQKQFGDVIVEKITNALTHATDEKK
jgi:hypothetical protein